MKPLIICFAKNGREQYESIQKGLIKTLPIAGDIDTWMINDYYEGITPHQKIPYLFKFDLINRAVSQGYRHIFWLDSSMRLLKNPFTLLEESETGIVAFDNLGHPAWKYTSDVAAHNLKLYYDDIYDVKQTWGGALGFDFDKPYAAKIMEAIFHQANLGSFNEGMSERPGFVSARHDQTVLSFLFHFYKIPLLEYGVIAASSHVTPQTVIQYGN